MLESQLNMERASAGLRKIMGGLLRQRSPEEAAVLAWPVVCGKEVAARTRAVAFVDARLTVEVHDAAWKTQLTVFIPRYIGGFAELIGPVVKEIRFVGKSN